MRDRSTHFAEGMRTNNGNWGPSDPKLVPDPVRLQAILEHPSFHIAHLETVVSDSDVPVELGSEAVQPVSFTEPMPTDEKIRLAGELMLANAAAVSGN